MDDVNATDESDAKRMRRLTRDSMARTAPAVQEAARHAYASLLGVIQARADASCRTSFEFGVIVSPGANITAAQRFVEDTSASGASYMHPRVFLALVPMIAGKGGFRLELADEAWRKANVGVDAANDIHVGGAHVEDSTWERLPTPIAGRIRVNWAAA